MKVQFFCLKTRKDRLAAIGFLAIGFLSLPWLGAAESLNRPSDACITCHPGSTSPHVSTWQLSQHSRAGVTCTECHGGEAGAVTAVEAHDEADPTMTDRGDVEKMCGRCHKEVLRLFNTSPFVQQGHTDENAPNCVTCHGAEGSDLIGLSELGRTCGQCHQEDGHVGHPDIPARAAQLMQDLNRLSLTRVLLEQAIRRHSVAAGQDTQARRQLESVNQLVGEHVLEWHRFDLDRVEANTQRALRELGDLYEQVTAH